jgi:putative tricarboxylic transport membrane protein
VLEDVSNLMQGFAVALTWHNVLFMLVGILLGVLIGVLPGLGGANGVAILLPLTFSMSPTSAIIMLSCIYWGALFGGAITSILFNIPGEPWSVATTFDGYPLAQKGRAGEAMTAAFTSSFVGALVAVIMITFLAPLVAKFALRFGPAEFFAVQFLTFCSFVGMGREPPAKTIASMMIGFGLAAVGLDTVTGQLRLTFGRTELLQGFDFLIAVIGLFGLGEIFLTMEEGLAFKGTQGKINPKVVLQTWAQLPRYWMTSLRACLIGCWMGVTPGGATPASFMSYGMARRMSKEKDKFGTGQIEGVVAPETAAHAAGTSALLPMLTLGIPGSPTAAVLLGGLLIWGLQPGPLLFVEKKEFVWGLIASMYLGNIVGLLIVLTTVPWWAAILRIPFSIIAPIIVVICAIGAYTVHNNMFDVGMMLVFGVVGYLFKKLKYPLAPLVLALVLGDMAESSFRQAMLLSGGTLAIFWSNGLVGSIMALALALLYWPLMSMAVDQWKDRMQPIRRRSRARRDAAAGATPPPEPKPK